MQAARIKYWRKRPRKERVVVRLTHNHNIQYSKNHRLNDSSFDLRSSKDTREVSLVLNKEINQTAYHKMLTINTIDFEPFSMSMMIKEIYAD